MLILLLVSEYLMVEGMALMVRLTIPANLSRGVKLITVELEVVTFSWTGLGFALISKSGMTEITVTTTDKVLGGYEGNVGLVAVKVIV